MLNILLVTFPFFALILAGYFAGHRRLLPLDAIPGLNTFVLFFALPCMLYRFGASTPIVQLLDATLFFTYLFCALLMVGFVVAVSFNKRIGWNDASFGALVGAFPNTGFMGVPLLVTLLGAAAAGPAIVTIVIDMVVTTSLCIALSRLDGADEHGASKAVKNALKAVVTNPLPWAITLGALSSAMNYELMGPIAKTVALLADAASPVALFTIGAVLARSQIRVKESGHPPMLLRDYMPVVFYKLLLHPVLVLLVLTAVVQMGFHIDRLAIIVVVLTSIFMGYVMLAARARRLLRSTDAIRRINRTTAGIMAGATPSSGVAFGAVAPAPKVFGGGTVSCAGGSLLQAGREGPGRERRADRARLPYGPALVRDARGHALHPCRLCRVLADHDQRRPQGPGLCDVQSLSEE